KIKKVTNPASDTTTSFPFTAGGGLSPSSFSLHNGDTQTFSNLVPGNGYNVAENVPTGWDLTGSSCDDGSPVTAIDLGPRETVTVGAGQNVPVTRTEPRKFRIIVVVCQQGTNGSLHASSVTVDGVTKTSLASGGGGSLSDSDVCGLGGARYSDKHAGDHPNAD